MQRFYLIMLIQLGWNFREGQEFEGARYQGRRVAETAAKLVG
jgi:hypothetical protein